MKAPERPADLLIESIAMLDGNPIVEIVMWVTPSSVIVSERELVDGIRYDWRKSRSIPRPAPRST